jgi:hypothetical protein
MNLTVATNCRQAAPRTLIIHARMAPEWGTSQAQVRSLVRRAAAWMRDADLSPPAIARMAERAADAPEGIGDIETIDSLRALVLRHDAGRDLRSYRLALRAIDAADAFANQDSPRAAASARAARAPSSHARSTRWHCWKPMHSNAAGQIDRAEGLYRMIAAGQLADGDVEAWAPLRAIAAARISSRGLAGD